MNLHRLFESSHNLRRLFPWASVKTVLGGTVAAAGLGAAIYGLVLYDQQRREESDVLLRQVEEELVFRDPEDPLSQSDLRSLKAQIDEAFNKNPRSARAWALGGIFQGYHAFVYDNYKESAANACRRAISFNDQDYLGYLCLGIASFAARNLKAADENLRTVVKYQPNWPIAWYYHGRVLWDLGNLAKAEAALAKARSLDPPKAGYGLELAKFYLLQGRTPEALRTLREVKASSDSPMARNALAAVLHAVGETEAAIEELSPALPSATEAQYFANMACMLNEVDRHEEALPMTVRALGLNPESRHALIEAINALVGLEKYSVALEYSTKLQPLAKDFRWVRTNHEYLTAAATLQKPTGAYMYAPIAIGLCEGWVLTRFSAEFREMSVALIAEGKYVFPPDLAGRPAGENRGVEVPPGKKVRISCKSSSSGPKLDPEWLGPQWMEKK